MLTFKIWQSALTLEWKPGFSEGSQVHLHRDLKTGTKFCGQTAVYWFSQQTFIDGLVCARLCYSFIMLVFCWAPALSGCLSPLPRCSFPSIFSLSEAARFFWWLSRRYLLLWVEHRNGSPASLWEGRQQDSSRVLGSSRRQLPVPSGKLRWGLIAPTQEIVRLWEEPHFLAGIFNFE